MAFNPNIPQPDDFQDESQTQLLANFQALKTLIDVNHETFGSANEGKHKYVTLPEQSSAPATSTNEMALYTKAVSGVTQMFLKNENSGSEVNFTSATKTTTDGTLTLPSGVILKWGQASTAASGKTSHTFGVAFPTAILTAYATISVIGGTEANAEANDRIVRIYDYTKTKISAVTYVDNVSRTRVSQSFTWFAIGY